jgi:hypothetical protein
VCGRCSSRLARAVPPNTVLHTAARAACSMDVLRPRGARSCAAPTRAHVAAHRTGPAPARACALGHPTATGSHLMHFVPNHTTAALACCTHHQRTAAPAHAVSGTARATQSHRRRHMGGRDSQLGPRPRVVPHRVRHVSRLCDCDGYSKAPHAFKFAESLALAQPGTGPAWHGTGPAWHGTGPACDEYS